MRVVTGRDIEVCGRDIVIGWEPGVDVDESDYLKNPTALMLVSITLDNFQHHVHDQPIHYHALRPKAGTVVVYYPLSNTLNFDPGIVSKRVVPRDYDSVAGHYPIFYLTELFVLFPGIDILPFR